MTTRRKALIIMLAGLFATTAWLPAAASGIPTAVVISDIFRFEPVIEGTEVIHEFVVRNTGTAPLEILHIETG